MNESLTIEECARLQGYQDGHAFAGNDGKRMLQIGNAVPPPVANAVLSTFPTRGAVLDLFAGSGVGVACHELGLKEYGVELALEARETRRVNNMETVYHDVWDAHLAEGLEFDKLWASPPCQTFSVAGNGAGRRALSDVLGSIESGAYRDARQLRRWADFLGDDRIGLVLSPLHYANRFHPTYIALEQVPPVLPVWGAMAAELSRLGYSTWTGYLHAEQYGVPQSRKRAYLIARDDGITAAPPAPTHSKYHTHDPERIDANVEKWVSIEEQLGYGGFRVVSNYSDGGGGRGLRDSSQPAATITSKSNRNKKEWK